MSVDLTPWMPPVMDQGNEDSCVAFATAYALFGYEARRDVWASIDPTTTDPAHNFSPSFVYNRINGGRNVPVSVGAALDVMQSGVATLATAPYSAGQLQRSGIFGDSAQYKVASFGSIQATDVTAIKARLAAGTPVVITLAVNAAFTAGAANAIYESHDGPFSLHAVTLTGYDDAAAAFSFQNSWGTTWGDGGRSRIAYEQFTNGIVQEAWTATDGHGTPPPPVIGASSSANAVAATTLPVTTCDTTCTVTFSPSAPSVTMEFTVLTAGNVTISPSAGQNAAPYGGNVGTGSSGSPVNYTTNSICMTINPVTPGANLTATASLTIQGQGSDYDWYLAQAPKPFLSQADCAADALATTGTTAAAFVPSTGGGNVRAPGAY